MSLFRVVERPLYGSARLGVDAQEVVKSMKQIRTRVITHWLKLHNLREVQYMAGHRYASSTEAYRINELEDRQEDIGQFHPIG